MREILFRAKRKDWKEFPKNERWIEGDLIHEPYGTVIQYICEEDDGKHVRRKVAVCPETVCEYTGLKDYNGRPIFENDIIRFHDDVGNWGREGVVLFEQGEYRYRMNTDAPSLYNCRICGEEDRFNVIGNIYDTED